MNRSQTFLLVFAIALTFALVAEALLRELPPSVVVQSSAEVPAAQTKAIGQRLGGQIERLTNSVVRVHGRSIQVNAITAVDEPNARPFRQRSQRSGRVPFGHEKSRL